MVYFSGSITYNSNNTLNLTLSGHLFADSYTNCSSKLDYRGIPIENLEGDERSASIKDYGDFPNNDGVNFDATIKLRGDTPYSIIINKFNLQLLDSCADKGDKVNFKISNLVLNIINNKFEIIKNY